VNREQERRLMLQGIAVTTLLGAVTPGVLAQGTGLKVSSLRSTARSWLWSAEDFASQRGLFTQAGLTVEMAATNRGVNHDALLSGAADILLGAPTQNMRAQLRRQPVRLIAGMVNKFASNIVVKKAFAEKAGVTEASPVEAKAAALRGLKIGTTGPGAGPDQLTRWVMRRGKIDPDRDAQLVPIQGGPNAMIAAFDKGQIDGFCLSSPTSDVAVQKFGGAYLFNMVTNPPPELSDYLYITASVTERTIKEKPAELTAYCRGIALALRGIHADRDAFKAWANTYFKDLDPALFEAAFANNVGIYMKTPVPTRAQFQTNLEFLEAELKTLQQPAPPAGYKFEDAWDLSFSQKAVAGL